MGRLPEGGVGQRHRDWWQEAVVSPRELNTEKTSLGWLPAKSSYRIGVSLTGMHSLSLWIWAQSLGNPVGAL